VNFKSKFLSSPKCGIPEEYPDDDKIIGGKDATLGKGTTILVED
jgi:hypothetical protein